MQRQHCHSEEIGRSTKNLYKSIRRQILDCTSFVFFLLARHSPSAAFGSQGKRFLTALRLSFSSLLGIIRKRSLLSLRSSIHFVQNDKVGLSRWDDRSRSGRTICCRRCSALRAVRAAASRSGGPQACPAGCARHSVRGDCINIRSKTIVPHPPLHSSERLLYSACYGLPHRVVGSLGQRRRSRLCVGFFVLCVGAFERCPVASRCGHGGSVVQLQPFVRLSRALRPSICSCF